MSFKLNWPAFSTEFLEKARAQLNAALNKGADSRPSNIVGDILVHSLNMGTKPPDLEVLEIGELQEERFRGIFKMAYTGDAHLELVTRVQANPLHTPRMNLAINGSRDGVLAASWPLVVPMRLKISNLVLRGIIVLVVDKHKGVTLVFKNDPLEKVDVNSTFDNIPNIRRFLQLQIETQLRKMFQEDLPALIHNLSLVYFRGQAEASAGRGSSSPMRMADGGCHGPVDEGAEIALKRPDVPKSMRDRWLGNDPIDFDEDDDAWVHGYIFYRNLSEICQALDLGLKNLATPRPLLSNKAVLRSWIVDQVVEHPHESLKLPGQPDVAFQHQVKRSCSRTSTCTGTSSKAQTIESFRSSGRPSSPRSAGGGGCLAPSMSSTKLSALATNFKSNRGIAPIRLEYSHFRRCSTRPRIPALAQMYSEFRTDFEEDCRRAFHAMSPMALNSSSRQSTGRWPSHPPHVATSDSILSSSARMSEFNNGDGEPFDFDAPLDIFTLNPPPSTPAAALAAAAECMQVPSPVTLLPTDNPRAAHLANLLDANRSLAIHTPSEEIRHWAFRAHPIRFLSFAVPTPQPFALSTDARLMCGEKDGGHASDGVPDPCDGITKIGFKTRMSAYNYSEFHASTRSTFVVSLAPSRRRRNCRAASPTLSPVRTPIRYQHAHFAPLPATPTHTYSFPTGSTNGILRPGANLATRNITKLNLPEGVSVPTHLLSPGLDQRLAEMGYINSADPQHPQYRRTKAASARNASLGSTTNNISRPRSAGATSARVGGRLR
ncbi:ERMES complex subunit [Geranomyces michiganensis]|nr:ERMES complex subunit [Geranomyces michiganensis]